MSNPLDVLVPLAADTSVPWEGGRRLADWWFEWASRTGQIPGLPDLDLRILGRHLSGIMVFEVEASDPVFRIRIAGEDYRTAAGFGLKGGVVDDFPETQGMRARFQWAIRERRPYMTIDQPLQWANKGFMDYSTLVAPLARDGGRVEALIAHCHFRLVPG